MAILRIGRTEKWAMELAKRGGEYRPNYPNQFQMAEKLVSKGMFERATMYAYRLTDVGKEYLNRKPRQHGSSD